MRAPEQQTATCCIARACVHGRAVRPPRMLATSAQPASCHAAQHSADLPADELPCSTAQRSTVQHSTAQHGTALHSTAQHSTAQHSTAQRSLADHGARLLVARVGQHLQAGGPPASKRMAPINETANMGQHVKGPCKARQHLQVGAGARLLGWRCRQTAEGHSCVQCMAWCGDGMAWHDMA